MGRRRGFLWAGRWGRVCTFPCHLSDPLILEYLLTSTDNQTHLALSDGVGGWAPQVDPSLFAQSLMYHYARSARSSPSSPPWDILKKGFEAVLGDKGVPAGSGTAVGVRMGDTGELKGVK